jgi:hypothetical protein
MRTRFLLLTFFSFILASSALSPISSAQGGGIGNNTTSPIAGVSHDYITGLNETVNPANGALSVRISQPVPHERGQNWPYYAFIYESNSVFGLMPGWQTLGTSPPTTYLTSLTACCTLQSPYPGIKASLSTATTCLQNGQFSCVTWTCVVNSYTYIDPNGGKHGLGIQRGIFDGCG